LAKSAITHRERDEQQAHRRRQRQASELRDADHGREAIGVAEQRERRANGGGGGAQVPERPHATPARLQHPQGRADEHEAQARRQHQVHGGRRASSFQQLVEDGVVAGEVLDDADPAHDGRGEAEVAADRAAATGRRLHALGREQE